MNWPLSAEVEINAFAHSAQIRLINEQPSQIVLEGGNARTISLIGFQKIKIPTSALWVFNPAKYDFQHDNYPETGWERLSVSSALVLTPADRASDSSVIIRPERTNSDSLPYGTIRAAGGMVSVSTPESRVVSVHIEGDQEDRTLQLPDRFLLLVNHCKDQGTMWGRHSQPNSIFGLSHVLVPR